MVDGFRFKVFRRGEDVGGVDATVEFGFGGTGYEGDFVAVVGARGFDELFLDFDAADGTEREGVLDAPGKIAAAGTDVHDGTSSAFRVRHGFSFQQEFDHRTRGGATRVQDLRSHVVVVFVDVLYEAFVVSRVFHDAFLIGVVVVVTRVVVVVVVVRVRVALEVVLSVAATGTGRGVAGAVSNHVMHVVGPVRIVLNFHEVSIESRDRVSFGKASVARPIQLYPQILRRKPRSKPFRGVFAQRRRSNHCSWRRAKL